MVNYGNGKVYKIINENNEIVYIGSTAQKLCKRYSTHEYKSPNHKIILIENYPCNSKEELCMREQQIIEQHNNLLNQIRAYQTKEQRKEQKKEKDKLYRENNKDIIKQKQKEYRENNKDILNQNKKEYYENNKDIINQKNKEYYENNKDIINQKKKEYYENNKHIINQKVKCEYCNCELNKSSLKTHQKSRKCLEFQKV